ncbi:Short-chain dehydrogenase [Streptoalloteichus tenebrarius]|uniref:Short-chain dehydrogenase n=1 Tax=Streptoalloteichus tenebrarius (strain ATCC 17920 / DSM 40477 / JCM 4838 / CBS 697.72 / NBRC 16177 / NCIMB 11028 / NRRL B-12390 / A12253. 1 / ISP 5477) TaxID=1933 RepID=A0ABT1HYX3_STRSD|nr:SDR family NAD(P)-dependent oxidoreductase [Streptoalloteichus tenebrarius]MCP2260694.1 Short-chain dehydrogenase [Streptoalloteichus tenebrarius]BFF03773.1 SDR family oxidoreductase [Streptoalloteichus tenebrarius]
MTRRLVVVTGGGRGVGRAVVARFAALGDEVVAVGRDVAALDATVSATVTTTGPRVRAEVCDVTDEAAVTTLFDRVGPVDVLVNNAGVAASAPLTRTTLADWHDHLEVNATGAFLCTRAALPGMVERGHGRIVVVASTAGRVGTRYTAAYTASKHAAVGLVRAAAAEVAGTGVTVNAVCPTFVRTDMTRRAVRRIAETTGRDETAAEAALARMSPLGRLLEPEEVAFAVAFLAAPEAAAVNGQALVLDGGGIQA